MSTKFIAVAVLSVIFILLVAIDGRRKVKKKRENGQTNITDMKDNTKRDGSL